MKIIVSDSDDDFLPTVTPTNRQQPKPVKKKVLTKTTTKKEKKVLTSSQTDPAPSKTEFMACLGLNPSLAVRSGRAARLTAEEAKFQQELAEAMRLSEEECSSSAEIVPPGSSNESQNARVESEETKPTPAKRKVEETEDSKKVETQSGEREEIVTVVNKGEEKEEEEEEEPRRTLSSTKKKVTKKTIISSDEEEGGCVQEKKSKRKTSPRKRRQKRNVVLSEDESNEEEEELENVKEHVSASTEKKTKLNHKPVSNPETPMVSGPLKARNSALPATPQLSSSLAAVLGKMSSSKSTPVSPGAPRAPLTPGQRKLPAWNPPAKVGTPGGLSGPAGSPSIGLRLGLSRKFKSKPLHASVKTKL